MLKVLKRENMKMLYLFYAKTVTSLTFTKGLLEVPEINSYWLTDLSSLLITAKIKSWDISGGLKQKTPFVPQFLRQGLRCQPHTTHHGPCPAHGQAARGSFWMFPCVFCCCHCLFSEQPEGPNLKGYLQSAPMLGFWSGQKCDFESGVLILLSFGV